jgi:tetratricopeptide (TPR) repeat protein
VEGEARTQHQMASIQLVRNDLSSAKKNFTASLRLSTQIRANSIMADCYSGLGKIASADRDLVNAKRFFEKAASQYRESRDILGEANQIVSLASISKSEDDANNVVLYQKALLLFAQAKDELGATNVNVALIEGGWKDGTNNREKIAALKRAAAAYSRLGATRSELRALNRCALLLQADFEFEEAWAILDDVTSRASISGFAEIEAFAIILTGVVGRRMQKNSWREDIVNGFSLLKRALRSNDPNGPAYDVLEVYLTSTNVNERNSAREQARQIWKDLKSVDYARLWLDTPTI